MLHPQHSVPTISATDSQADSQATRTHGRRRMYPMSNKPQKGGLRRAALGSLARNHSSVRSVDIVSGNKSSALMGLNSVEPLQKSLVTDEIPQEQDKLQKVQRRAA